MIKAGKLYSSIMKNSLISRRTFLAISVLILFFNILIFSGFTYPKSGAVAATENWVGTWSTAPQLVERNNMPPEPGLTNNTIRQIVCVSIGGKTLQMRFSNEFSEEPVTMRMVQIAVSKGGSAIDESTVTEIKFDGKAQVTMEPGISITSDPFDFNLDPRMEVAITIAFGETSPSVTGHPGSRTTSYILSGNQTTPSADYSEAVKTDHWYVINGIDVIAPKKAAAVAIIGNSITDGRGSGTNKQNRWPDELAKRLLANKKTKNIGVLNMGIGGNCVLRGGLGPTALSRFERDILNQHGVKWLIILEGVNDLGGTRNKEMADGVANGLIEAYGKMIDDAHAKGIKVYGATITQIKESFYYADYREEARKKVNDWIRSSGRFDTVIDFDKTMEDPNNPDVILDTAHDGDHLHPNELGYQMMGGAIDLKLFK